MAFIPVNNGVLVELVFDSSSGVMENTLWFHWEGVSDITPLDLSSLAASIGEWWVQNMAALTGNAITLREVVATEFTSQISPSASVVMLEPGLSASPELPSVVTFCVSFRTFNRGRSFRGRNYTVGMVDSQVTIDTVSSTYVTDVVDAYAALPSFIPTVLGVPAWSWVVVSFRSNNADRSSGLQTPIEAVVATDDLVDHQERRLAGRGS